MNKKIKRIIACTIAVAGIVTIEPAKYINLMTIKAYASSSDRAYLNDINVNHGSLSFSDSKTSYTVKVGSSIDSITIDVSADSDYDVTIDGEDGNSNTVDLNKGDNRIRIKVKDTTGDKDPVTYYVNVIRGSSSSSDDNYDDDNYDDIYLQNITVNEGTLDFSRTTSRYTINVPSSLDKIEIKAKPEDSEDNVSVDGNIVNKGNNYAKTVTLNQGTNTIKVTVIDADQNERTYTLYINRGGNTTTTSSGVRDTEQDSIYLDTLLIDNGNTYLGFTKRVTSYNVNVNKSCDEIIIKAEPEDSGNIARVNGDRVDSDGKKIVKLNEGKNEIKVKVSNEDDTFDDNSDYRDNFEERTYTINVNRGGSTSQTNATNSNVTLKTDQWVNVAGNWQYNDSLGNTLKNTWFNDKSNGNWYYLNETGIRQVGWKQLGGKWYYLYSTGEMAYNTTIDGYKLASNGAWI
jgi:hypothetical protein